MQWIGRKVRERIRFNEFYTFFMAKYDYGYEFAGETHNFWEFLYVVKGKLCVSADDKVYNLSEGDVIFHKPLELHKFHITDESGVQLLIVSYSAEGELSEFFENKVFSLDYNQKQTFLELVDYAQRYGMDEHGNIRNYIGAFEGEALYSQNICMCLCDVLISLAENGTVLQVSHTVDSIVFAKTVKYMNNRVCEMPSVEDFAKHAAVSVSGLKRIFSRYAGMGVHKYFMMLKLNKATALLNQGLPVTETAEKLGFSSQGYFSNFYKRETGYMPTEISKKL